MRIKGSDLQTWFDVQPTGLDDTASCQPRKDGSPSGMKTAAERGAVWALRELRTKQSKVAE